MTHWHQLDDDWALLQRSAEAHATTRPAIDVYVLYEKPDPWPFFPQSFGKPLSPLSANSPHSPYARIIVYESKDQKHRISSSFTLAGNCWIKLEANSSCIHHDVSGINPAVCQHVHSNPWCVAVVSSQLVRIVCRGLPIFRRHTRHARDETQLAQIAVFMSTLCLLRVARNPRGSTPSSGRAPARRFETRAHGARAAA